MTMGVTHPVLCGNAINNIISSRIEKIFVTNTVHIEENKRIDQISVISVAPLIAEAIRRIHTGESVGALFE
jgi:ribose-phosphate pyrophosphokinase